VQSPETAEYAFMPLAAIERNPLAQACETEEIVHCILQNPVNR
jgi:hypothetical protein